MTSTETVLRELPVVIRRRVKWGECDPAGVVYTVVFSEYVMSAAELFYGALFQTTPQRAKDAQGFGTPTRALAFDFQRSLRPDDEFELTVLVAAIGRSSYALEITARTLPGEGVFSARLTPVCVASHERRPIELPDAFRAALRAYQSGCAEAAGSAPGKAAP